MIPSMWYNIKDNSDTINIGTAQPKINQWFVIQDRGMGLIELVNDKDRMYGSGGRMYAKFVLTTIDSDMEVKNYDSVTNKAKKPTAPDMDAAREVYLGRYDTERRETTPNMYPTRTAYTSAGVATRNAGIPNEAPV